MPTKKITALVTIEPEGRPPRKWIGSARATGNEIGGPTGIGSATGATASVAGKRALEIAVAQLSQLRRNKS